MTETVNAKLLRKLMEKIAPIIASYVRGSIEPLAKRLDVIEAWVIEFQRKGLEFAGTHQRGAEYRRGQAVVSGGSLWIATTTTTETPGKTNDWALAAKAGRDGKDAR